MLYNFKWKFWETLHFSEHDSKLENENTNNTTLHQNYIKLLDTILLTLNFHVSVRLSAKRYE